MKKVISFVLVCLLLAGCGSAAQTPTTPQPDPTPAPTNAPTEEVTQAPTDEPTAEPTDEPTAEPTDEPTQAATTAPVLAYTLYLPDENAEGFDEKEIQTGLINADTVLAELQAAGVLPEGVLINAFGADGNQLNIDFNQAFADLVCSMGTSGERMIIGSVVNTYMSAFQAESVYFTIDGEILESGHVVYDFPITFVE